MCFVVSRVSRISASRNLKVNERPSHQCMLIFHASIYFEILLNLKVGLIKETIEDLDKNDDGVVSLEGKLFYFEFTC